MGSNYTEYYVQLINKRTKAPINDDTGLFIVMEASEATLQTIYSDANGTAPAFVYTNVASTMTDGKIRFWTASSVTSVDVTFITAAGQAGFIEALTSSQHRYEVDTEQLCHTLILPFYNYIPTPFVSASVTIYTSAGLGSVWSQGMSLPAGALVKNCFCRVETLGTGSLVNFGVSGTPAGLLQQVTGSVTGLKWASGLIATGGTLTFGIGTLLQTATTFGRAVPIFITAATAIVFGEVTGTCLAAREGWVYIQYDLLPNRV